MAARPGNKPPEKEGLRQEVQELNRRILELEQVISELREPLGQMNRAATGYFKFIDMYIRFGGVAPDKVLPKLRDPISREIINLLFQKEGLNISQITEALRERRGCASRRTVRSKLEELEGEGYVARRRAGNAAQYSVTDELKRKWSQALGLV